MLDEGDDDDDFALMIAYANYESTERAWGMTSAEHKRTFMMVAQKLRRDENRMLPDAYDEWEDMVWEAKELSAKYNSDPKHKPDEDITSFNAEQPARVAPSPSSSEDKPPPPPMVRRFGKG